MAVAKATTPATLEIPELRIRVVNLKIVGDSPLIVHAWSKKARDEMLAKQMGKAQAKKAPKDPEQDYREAFYYTEDGRYGFPAVAFKAAAVDAASQVSGLTKVFLRGAFHVIGEMVPIEGEPRMREDMVRVGMGTADIRFRPEFPTWSATVPVRMSSVITLEQLVHLFNQAGFSCGIGEWRPQKDGPFGMFHVEAVEEV
jgi:hypothetical protein